MPYLNEPEHRLGIEPEPLHHETTARPLRNIISYFLQKETQQICVTCLLVALEIELPSPTVTHFVISLTLEIDNICVVYAILCYECRFCKFINLPSLNRFFHDTFIVSVLFHFFLDFYLCIELF